MNIILLISYLSLCVRLASTNRFNVYVIGGSGVLGTALLQQACSIPRTNVFAGVRTESKVAEVKAVVNVHEKSRLTPFLLKFWDSKQSVGLTLPHLSHLSRVDHIILINNAGVCLEGRDLATMTKSLEVNTILPMITTQTIALQSHRHPLKQYTVINISSGDGERLYLNSNLAAALDKISSVGQLKSFISDVLLDQFRPSTEYAFGPTPFYSVSKALLNKATELCHAESQSNMRVISCCPGNFASPMSQSHELATAINPNTAASYIMQVALEIGKYPGGKFYRYGKEIPW